MTTARAREKSRSSVADYFKQLRVTTRLRGSSELTQALTTTSGCLDTDITDNSEMAGALLPPIVVLT